MVKTCQKGGKYAKRKIRFAHFLEGGGECILLSSRIYNYRLIYDTSWQGFLLVCAQKLVLLGNGYWHLEHLKNKQIFRKGCIWCSNTQFISNCGTTSIQCWEKAFMTFQHTINENQTILLQIAFRHSACNALTVPSRELLDFFVRKWVWWEKVQLTSRNMVSASLKLYLIPCFHPTFTSRGEGAFKY